MKKLLTDYGFNNDYQYYDMIGESFINGQRKQAIEQFKAMPVVNQKEIINEYILGVSDRMGNNHISLLVDAL